MSILKPPLVPTWATDANYPAGGDPWSAQPLKVDPGGGTRAAGHVPDTRPPAEWENWFKNATGGWLGYLSERSPLRNWYAPLAFDTAANPFDNNVMRNDNTQEVFWSETYHAWFMFGSTAGGAWWGDQGYMYKLGFDALHYTFGCETADGRILLFIASNAAAASNMVCARSDVKDLTVWNHRTIAVSAFTNTRINSAVRIPSDDANKPNRIVVVGGIDAVLSIGLVFVSDDNGNTWAPRTAAGLVEFNRVIVGKKIGGAYRLVAWGLVAAASQGDSLVYSDDGGETWTAVLAVGFDLIQEGVYSPDWDAYFFSANSASTQPGINKMTTIGGSVTHIAVGSGPGFTCVGGVLVAFQQYATALVGQTDNRIVVSPDGGTTWQLAHRVNGAEFPRCLGVSPHGQVASVCIGSIQLSQKA